MDWWTNKRFRMIQNNLRDIDACMDIDKYVDTLKQFHANACMVGCGGITAFYPTNLDCQKRSNYLRNDFFGLLLKKCHENDIRVIARFDFSKTNIEFLSGHPEWFSVSVEGDSVLFNDTAATCVNGPYQQEKSLLILEEVLEKYPVDGVFFNMFGYQTRDYNNHYVGICQCGHCKKRFHEYSGATLPTKENPEDPVFRKYQEFKKYTTEDLLNKIYQKVKSIRPETAVCTYSNKIVDLVRNESNSAVDRPLPFWQMASEDNVSVIRGTYENRFSSNCVINAVDIFYRFMGVSPWLNKLRLYGDMAAGGNLDWCIIGGFETYPDQGNFEGVKEIFSFHERYENLFNNLKSLAGILLVKPYGNADAEKEYRGIFKSLKEEHLLFDVVDGREEERLKDLVDKYEMVIFAGQEKLSDKCRNKIQQAKGKIIATGLSFENDVTTLKEIFGIALGEEESTRGGYLLTEPKEIFRDFQLRNWVYLDKKFRKIQPLSEGEGYLPQILPSMYGPPERCFGHAYTDNCSIFIRDNKAAYFSWMPGNLYESHGYEDFKKIVISICKNKFHIKSVFETDAPECIEIFMDRCGEKEYLLQIMNYSGCNGNVFRKPLPVEFSIVFSQSGIQDVYELGINGKKRINYNGKLNVKCNDVYKAYLVKE